MSKSPWKETTYKGRNGTEPVERQVARKQNIKYKGIELSNQKVQSGWLDYRKKDPTKCCLRETHFNFKDTHKLNEMEKDIPCKSKWKRVGETILSDKIDLEKRL